MRNLATALLVIFTIILTAQSVRHTYFLAFSKHESVLDRYNKKKADMTIDKSMSLTELAMIYADAEKRIRLSESGKAKKTLAQYNPGDDPYIKKAMIEEIITKRESDYKALKEIIFYFVTGLLLAGLGSFLYLKFEIWVGAPVVISGFIEMIFKTGPQYFAAGDISETVFVLTVKLILSLFTLAGVIAYWYYLREYFNR